MTTQELTVRNSGSITLGVAGAVVAVLAAAAAGWASVRHPESTVIAVFLMLAALFLTRTTLGLTPLAAAAAIILAMVPIPQAFPAGVGLGSGSLLWGHLLSLLIIALSLSRIWRAADAPARWAVGILALIVLQTAVGVVRGSELPVVVRDGRGMTQIAAVLLVFAGVNELERLRRARFLFDVAKAAIILGGLASIAINAGVTGLRTRIGSSTLYAQGVDSSIDALRVVPDTSTLASFYLGGWLALLCLGKNRLTGRFGTVTMVAATLTVVLSYTRSYIMVVVIMPLIVLVLARSRLRFLGRFALFAACGSAVVFVVTPLFGSTEFVAIAIRAFDGRVLDGLQPGVVETDTSVLWRITETNAVLGRPLTEWLTGAGYGSVYRGHLPGDPFGSDVGLSYIHNGFLAFGYKHGLIASAGVLLGLVRAVPALRNVVQPYQSIAIAALFALFLLMIPSPVPQDQADSLTVGLIFGLIWLATQYARVDSVQTANSAVRAVAQGHSL